MTTYCTDADLVALRPNILGLGVDSWSDEREKAYSTINRIVEARWYKKAAVELGYDPKLTSFDPSLVEEDSLKDLEVYKALELAYLHLMKGSSEEDGFERLAKKFRGFYNEELETVLAVGISYDFSGNGVFDADETLIQAPRRLGRV
jgi:hypothetical protein